MKILYVTTISNTVNAFLIPHIKMLVDQGHQVDLAFNIVQEVNSELVKMGCTVHRLKFERSPLKKQNYLAYKELKKIIKDEQYDLIHTHTPVASACVRLACKAFKDVKVIYTAHGFHFYKGASYKNWLLYYSIEKWLARYTDVLITINKEDYKRAKKSFNAGRVEYIPGVGLNVQRFSETLVDRKTKRNEICIPEDAFVVLSVGELNPNKNHETIIRAISKLNNPNIYYVICGQGPLNKYLSDLVKELNMENQVKLLGIRNDIAEICKISDVFVFPSFREGLSVALMEAMASGLPIICSDIRGNRDLIENKKGGYLVSPNDISGFAKYIESILMFSEDSAAMAKHNIDIIESFSTRNVLKRMQEIYSIIN
ncbi:glycosyltransferase family 4 protein [Peribacillus simplex]|uniref:Glycosyltransferase family 4 protein n=2 Tax=Peribacillus TaxID=2675229 RepID=A0AA90SUI4_9BACI|nr:MULTISPECIES: glycosyltransferase family 4 protein [Peribacillus]MDP1417450.1 glycosyltransferase family 4 protein [Peribacillus simplex]MDP1450105.1 glycosyltransferase family 4 protein [Peribacillus frigoritolerans]